MNILEIDYMIKVFISYRRDDSLDITGRIEDNLRHHFGDEQVFRDLNSIPAGAIFSDYIRQQIEFYDVVLVIIGKNWLDIKDKLGQRRIDHPTDLVRIEVEMALRQNKRVIPILVDNAKIPNELELPPSIRNLMIRNFTYVRQDPSFRDDIKRLINDIDKNTQQNSHHKFDILEVLPPPFEWCEIPAGKINRINVNLSSFEVSKHPITNAQYDSFIKADDGYQELGWWNYSDTTIAWRQLNPAPIYSSFDGILRPREMVSWYEAKAFCNWLSYKTRQIISLPTEIQRERLTNNKQFPWGDKFDSKKCNTREFWLKATTSVDKYPQGVSEYGIYDLVGNVWEWGEVVFESKYQPPQTAVFGGGWYSRRRHTVSNHYRIQQPEYKAQDVGFRICKLNPMNTTE